MEITESRNTEPVKKSGLLRKSRLIILIFSLLIAGEIIFAFFHHENGDYFLNDKKETVCFNKSVLRSIYKNFTEVPYSYCSEFNSLKTPGTYRIFLLGEASISGWPYSNKESVGNKIENNLARFAPSEKIEVITISFAGFNSYHASEIIPQVLKYKPDLIILYSGHNEFYGYKGENSKLSISDFALYNIAQSLLGSKEKIKYDFNTDDFELVLPVSSVEKFILRENHEYNTAIKNYYENMINTAELCRQNKTNLILTDVCDNNLMPPLGVSNTPEELSADIIFNNARMALLRDGNDTMAEKLFNQSKDLDLFRLRVPGEFSSCLKKIVKKSGVELADFKNTFAQFSINCIPGDDLFVDYIHPNRAGLDIIAAEYSRMILNRIGNNSFSGIEELLENQKQVKSITLEENNPIEKLRIKKASERLKNAMVLQKYAPASLVE